jgi:hypothetical protein
MKRIPNNTLLVALFMLVFGGYTTAANAQDKKAAPKKTTATKSKSGAGGFKKLPSGLVRGNRN